LRDFITEAIDDNPCGKQFTVLSEDEGEIVIPHSLAKAIKDKKYTYL